MRKSYWSRVSSESPNVAVCDPARGGSSRRSSSGSFTSLMQAATPSPRSPTANIWSRSPSDPRGRSKTATSAPRVDGAAGQGVSVVPPGSRVHPSRSERSVRLPPSSITAIRFGSSINSWPRRQVLRSPLARVPRPSAQQPRGSPPRPRFGVVRMEKGG